VNITPEQFKMLLSVYASNYARGVKSHLGDRRGDVPGACISTIGVIIAHTPPAYRVRGESVLCQWCEARQLETIVEDRISEVRRIDRYGKKVKELEYQLSIVVEHTRDIENSGQFRSAIDWAAIDLERRLWDWDVDAPRVSLAELRAWESMIGEALVA
jgi:hypothetical protein